MPPRGAIWARVSTEEQESGNQLAALRAEAARRGLEVTAEYVLDGLSAWTGAHRGQLRSALGDARAGGYEVLLVWALDRLERGGIEATLRVMRQFRERGVRVVSLQEPWTDAGGEMQELLTAIMAWVARMERIEVSRSRVQSTTLLYSAAVLLQARPTSGCPAWVSDLGRSGAVTFTYALLTELTSRFT